MDTSIIKLNEISPEYGIRIGNSNAKPLIEFINLRCPYCKQWYESSKKLLQEATSQGKIERVIKLTDRQKGSLQNGNIMHRFVTTDNAEKTLTELDQIFKTQDQWGDLSSEEIIKFATDELGLIEHEHSGYAHRITEESERANIKFVPTVIIGSHIFDEHISNDLLDDYLNE
ncbi:MAG TPA: DsbA family protein [Candidatus Tetragenococcus pullicola]|nr:DsbA family protein [Candidatus Tetragenococcus pullicola]